MKKTAITLAALALAGCSLAPVYQRPAAPVAPAWPTGPAYQAPAGAAAAAAVTPAASEILWRDYFADPALRDVIALALNNNRDLRVSVLNIEKARAQYGIDSAALLPSVSANVSQSAVRTPANMRADGQAAISRQYNGVLQLASYELDFFGKVRNLSDIGLQQYLGTQEARRAQQITLVAEVANSYLNLVADRQRLALAADTLTSQQQSYELSRRRFDSGVTSGLDVYDAQTSVESARADVALYTAQAAQDRNALELLVGAAVPDSLLPDTTATTTVAGTAGSMGAANAANAAAGASAPDRLRDTTARLAVIPAGLPSELLQMRPDVQQAERTLRAANANIGVARAAFFPSISLTASGGSASGSLSGLFKGGSSTWSFIPQLNLPIFNGGVNQANLDIARAERDISVAAYEKSIQSAFREVADALATRGTIDERLAAQQALVEAAGKSYRIHQARYEKGAESYLNALVSQRALYAAQQGLITTRLSKSGNAVTLYKVLGGGWQPEG